MKTQRRLTGFGWRDPKTGSQLVDGWRRGGVWRVGQRDDHRPLSGIEPFPDVPHRARVGHDAIQRPYHLALAFDIERNAPRLGDAKQLR